MMLTETVLRARMYAKRRRRRYQETARLSPLAGIRRQAHGGHHEQCRRVGFEVSPLAGSRSGCDHPAWKLGGRVREGGWN